MGKTLEQQKIDNDARINDPKLRLASDYLRIIAEKTGRPGASQEAENCIRQALNNRDRQGMAVH